MATFDELLEANELLNNERAFVESVVRRLVRLCNEQHCKLHRSPTECAITLPPRRVATSAGAEQGYSPSPVLQCLPQLASAVEALFAVNNDGGTAATTVDTETQTDKLLETSEYLAPPTPPQKKAVNGDFGRSPGGIVGFGGRSGHQHCSNAEEHYHYHQQQAETSMDVDADEKQNSAYIRPPAAYYQEPSTANVSAIEEDQNESGSGRGHVGRGVSSHTSHESDGGYFAPNLSVGGHSPGSAQPEPPRFRVRLPTEVQPIAPRERRQISFGFDLVQVPRDSGANSVDHLRVVSVQPGSPADCGGMWPGDILLSIDTFPVPSHSHFIALVEQSLQFAPKGTKCLVEVLRGGNCIQCCFCPEPIRATTSSHQRGDGTSPRSNQNEQSSMMDSIAFALKALEKNERANKQQQKRQLTPERTPVPTPSVMDESPPPPTQVPMRQQNLPTTTPPMQRSIRPRPSPKLLHSASPFRNSSDSPTPAKLNRRTSPMPSRPPAINKKANATSSSVVAAPPPAARLDASPSPKRSTPQRRRLGMVTGEEAVAEMSTPTPPASSNNSLPSLSARASPMSKRSTPQRSGPSAKKHSPSPWR